MSSLLQCTRLPLQRVITISIVKLNSSLPQLNHDIISTQMKSQQRHCLYLPAYITIPYIALVSSNTSLVAKLRTNSTNTTNLAKTELKQTAHNNPLTPVKTSVTEPHNANPTSIQCPSRTLDQQLTVSSVSCSGTLVTAKRPLLTLLTAAALNVLSQAPGTGSAAAVRPGAGSQEPGFYTKFRRLFS